MYHDYAYQYNKKNHDYESMPWVPWINMKLIFIACCHGFMGFSWQLHGNLMDCTSSCVCLSNFNSFCTQLAITLALKILPNYD